MKNITALLYLAGTVCSDLNTELILTCKRLSVPSLLLLMSHIHSTRMQDKLLGSLPRLKQTFDIHVGLFDPATGRLMASVPSVKLVPSLARVQDRNGGKESTELPRKGSTKSAETSSQGCSNVKRSPSASHEVKQSSTFTKQTIPTGSLQDKHCSSPLLSESVTLSLNKHCSGSTVASLHVKDNKHCSGSTVTECVTSSHASQESTKVCPSSVQRAGQPSIGSAGDLGSTAWPSTGSNGHVLLRGAVKFTILPPLDEAAARAIVCSQAGAKPYPSPNRHRASSIDQGGHSHTSSNPHPSPNRPRASSIDQVGHSHTSSKPHPSPNRPRASSIDQGGRSHTSSKPHPSPNRHRASSIDQGGQSHTSSKPHPSPNRPRASSIDQGGQSHTSSKPHPSPNRPRASSIDQGGHSHTSSKPHPSPNRPRASSIDQVGHSHTSSNPHPSPNRPRASSIDQGGHSHTSSKPHPSPNRPRASSIDQVGHSHTSSNPHPSPNRPRASSIDQGGHSHTSSKPHPSPNRPRASSTDQGGHSHTSSKPHPSPRAIDQGGHRPRANHCHTSAKPHPSPSRPNGQGGHSHTRSKPHPPSNRPRANSIDHCHTSTKPHPPPGRPRANSISHMKSGGSAKYAKTHSVHSKTPSVAHTGSGGQANGTSVKHSSASAKPHLSSVQEQPGISQVSSHEAIKQHDAIKQIIARIQSNVDQGAPRPPPQANVYSTLMENNLRMQEVIKARIANHETTERAISPSKSGQPSISNALQKEQASFSGRVPSPFKNMQQKAVQTSSSAPVARVMKPGPSKNVPEKAQVKTATSLAVSQVKNQSKGSTSTTTLGQRAVMVSKMVSATAVKTVHASTLPLSQSKAPKPSSVQASGSSLVKLPAGVSGLKSGTPLAQQPRKLAADSPKKAQSLAGVRERALKQFVLGAKRYRPNNCGLN